jgi:hypothetical protein
MQRPDLPAYDRADPLIASILIASGIGKSARQNHSYREAVSVE